MSGLGWIENGNFPSRKPIMTVKGIIGKSQGKQRKTNPQFVQFWLLQVSINWPAFTTLQFCHLRDTFGPMIHFLISSPHSPYVTIAEISKNIPNLCVTGILTKRIHLGEAAGRRHFLLFTTSLSLPVCRHIFFPR